MRLAPAHGEVIEQPQEALELLETNLVDYLTVAERGYRAASPSPAWPESTVTRISEHLLVVTGTNASFHVLQGTDGSSLFFDYGFASDQHVSAGFRFVQHSVTLLEEQFGLQPPAVVIPTHYHDDHVSGLAHLQRAYGTEVWAFEHFADLIERPGAYRLPCLWGTPARVDRVLRDRERFDWGGHNFEARHNPGHTWFAAAFFGTIDGRSIAVTGDAVKYAADGTLWGGSPTFRNRVGPDDFITCIDTIAEYDPELLLTGHWGPIEVGTVELEAYRRWATALRRSIRQLVADPAEIGFALDPDVVSVRPYESRLNRRSALSVEVEVRNHHTHAADSTVSIVVPEGWQTEPKSRRRTLAAGEISSSRFEVVIPQTETAGIRHLLFAEVTLGERELGYAAEGLVTIVDDESP